MTGNERFRELYWVIVGGDPERLATRSEWITRTMAAGVRPSTMRWWTRGASGRIEYVLPKEG